MLRSPVLVTILLLASGRLLAQQSSPDRLPLAEQFRMHYFIDDSIVAALPGYVDFASDFPCTVVVYLMNPRTWGDSAGALFRNALPPDTSELSRSYCAGRPEVRVRASRYTRPELAAFAERITTVLQEPALKVRGSIRVTPETLIVGAHNQAALERARIRLAREEKLPQAMLAYRVWKPEEVDGPVTPPRDAYLAVLDTIAAAPSELGRPFVIDAGSLPATVGEDDLRQRGLRSQAASDTCGTPTVVSFQQPRQFVDGRYAFSVSWRLNDYYYEVDCRPGACRVRNAAQLPGDKISTGCARVEFGANGSAAAAQDRLDLAIAAGPSPYDLSGTGTGASGAVFLAWRPVRGLVLEPGVTVFTYRSQFDQRTYLVFPELSVQAELSLGRFYPFLGGGGGGAFVLSGSGETVATLHAVGGARIDISAAWGLRGEMRIRAVRPWTGNTVDFLFGVSRRLR